MVARDLAESRSRAQALIMAGRVFSGERRIDKPGENLDGEAPLDLRGPDHPWVSRGGLKLDYALRHFGIGTADRICLDIGASTGGFTDVLLQAGATRVYAVDVGRGQLHWRLRNDGRVVVLEATNARHLTAAHIPEAPELIVCDASFIGLEKILPAPMALAAPGATLIALVKPQFQAGRAEVGKGGVIRDPAVHARVCEEAEAWVAAQPGWRVLGIVESPVTGAGGNVEFLLAAEQAL